MEHQANRTDYIRDFRASPREIVVRQASGLGNQLFQYAAGRYLAKQYGARLRIAHELPREQYLCGYPRLFLLPKFAITAACQPMTLLDRGLSNGHASLARAGQLLRASLNCQTIRQSHRDLVRYSDFQRDSQIRPGTRVVYLVGYWQAYPIVQAVERELRAELTVIEPLSGKNLALAQRIAAEPTPVSMHVRRGDYATEFVLTMEYYERAIRFMRERHERPVFFVFSDDTRFVRDWLQDRADFVVVDHNDATSAHEDLRLMSLCHHHVMANSTFSWWGAWLNSRQDKQVLLPGRWLGIDTAATDLVAPGWTLIDC